MRGALRAGAARIFESAQQTSGRSNSMTNRSVTNPSHIYNEQTAREGRSFFRDLVLHKTGDDADGEARARLNQHTQEQRIGGLTTTGDGAPLSPRCGWSHSGSRRHWRRNR